MNNKNQLKIVIASDVDYEDLIAEIYCDGEFIALLQQEEGKEQMKVEFTPGGKPVNFEFLQNALVEAKKALLGKS